LSAVIAYVVAHVSHAVLNYALARRTLQFDFGPDNRRLLLASFALLVGLTVWTPRDILGVALALASLTLWAALVVRPDEWRTVWQAAQRMISPQS